MLFCLALVMAINLNIAINFIGLTIKTTRTENDLLKQKLLNVTDIK